MLCNLFHHAAVAHQSMAADVEVIFESQLTAVLSELIEQPGAQKPERVKFFRGQMQTIITRALTELDIKPVPSRRCFTLLSECIPFLVDETPS